jgi:hypothetical protein
MNSHETHLTLSLLATPGKAKICRLIFDLRKRGGRSGAFAYRSNADWTIVIWRTFVARAYAA